MAIENTYLLGKNITLGCGFDLQAKAPLDSRQTVPAFAGLQALIDGNAAYEGMIVYDEETKKTYQAQLVDDVLAFREFGINEAELKDLIASETTAAMEFKGAAATLPENPAKGDMYKVTASFKIGEEDVKIGDSIVYDGEQWFIIPSGDDIEDTWRPVTGVDNDATLTFAAGDKLEKTVAADGTITYKHVAIDAPTNMNEEGDEQTRTYITQLITDNHGHVIGFKTATENVEDTNTTYEFEGLPTVEGDVAPSSVYFQVKSSDAESAEVIYLDAYNKNEADAEFAKKVDKVEGYSLVSDTEIARLAEVDNYDDEEVRGLIGDNAQAIEDLETYVGTIPSDEAYAEISDVIGYINKKAEETLAAASGNSTETAASVKQQLDNYKSENNTRVKAVEDDVAAIKDAETGILKQAQDYADGLAGNYDEAGAAAGVKSELETEIAKKVDAEAYEADKATFAIAETVNAALDLKANAADVVANDTFESFKAANTQAIADAKAGAVSDVEAKGYAVATEVAETYATKTELGNVDAKFADYVTTASYAEDKAAIEKSIEDEAKALAEVDAGFETRIANLEANFGDGEGTVEAQIATAVAAEAEIARAAEKANADDIDALEGRMTTAEGKIADLEAASATHATKDELNGVDAKFAQYVTSASYAEDKAGIDEAIADRYTKSEADGKFALIADAYDDEEVRGLISAEKERAEAAEADLQTQINTIMNNPDAEGAINSINEFTQYVKDHGTIADGFRSDIDKNKEDIATNAKAIADQATSDAATYETKTDATAKLAEAKAHADNAVATEKAAREAADAELAAAIEAAKTEASNQSTVVLAEAQKYTDSAKAEAIADAASKYEAKGTAQGIVDALKLGETYEPIGAETRAIAAAKGETEAQVKALAGEGNTSTVKQNADDIASLYEMFQWGSF